MLRLATLEPLLQKHRWQTVKFSDYDQRYYRHWMHEWPPLPHRLRGTVVDIHHTILPETSRLKPDPAQLIAAARPLPSLPFHTFAPTDLVLHSAAHAFHDGELANPCATSSTRTNWSPISASTNRSSGMPYPPRPVTAIIPTLFYGLRYAQRFLGTPVPPSVTRALRCAAPPGRCSP